jgi:O-methyltransferase involved in polyketide biosynthesis
MTQSLTKLVGVPRTMLLTTRARVDEHQRVDALFRDPKAFEWWQAITWDADLDRLYTPLGQLSWAVRAHTFDQVVQQHLARYADAVVVELGAGLSTRFYRIGQRCQSWIDLDLPAGMRLRRQFDHETEQHRLISQSALDVSWMDQVPDGPPERVLILAEGLLMYFTFEQVQQLVQQLQQRFPNATFMFEVIGGASKGKAAKVLAKLGAPLQWLVKDEHDLGRLGLAIVNVRSLVQENCRYSNRIGLFRWLTWLTKLPYFRNASLMLETRILPLP